MFDSVQTLLTGGEVCLGTVAKPIRLESGKGFILDGAADATLLRWALWAAACCCRGILLGGAVEPHSLPLAEAPDGLRVLLLDSAPLVCSFFPPPVHRLPRYCSESCWLVPPTRSPHFGSPNR